MVVVLVLPFVVIFAIAIVAAVFVRRSSLSITSDGVEIRNYPQAARAIPLALVAHFEETPRTGNFRSLRPATAVLILTDGTRLPVRSVAAPEAGVGVDALNRRVDTLRDAG